MMRIVLVLFLIIAPCSVLHADVQDDLQGVNQKISETRKKLNVTRKTEKKVSGELSHIDATLREKESHLTGLARNLQVVEARLGKTGVDIEGLREDAENKRREISRRLASLYKAGEVGTLRIFFSSDSFPALAENQRYMRSVVEYDRRLFAAYNEKIDHLKKLKVELEQDHERKEQLKGQIEVKKREIEAEKQKKATFLQQVKAERKGFQVSLKELEANARRLQSMMAKLEAQSRKGYTQQDEQKRLHGTSVPSLPPVQDTGFSSQKGRLALPVRGEITARFGRHKHPEFNSYTVSNGISVAAPAGTDIRSIYTGKVIYADYFKGYGNMVIIDHGGGYFSLYAHASRIARKVGASVSRNDVIASVGDLDSPRGPQLYFEIRHQGRPVDPMQWVR
jgi:septal ring factor EnvC (AmiA/AmiB activator)